MQTIAWHSRIALQRPTVVCIPVCNEAERILACLQSFAHQDCAQPFELLLLLNNCTDRTVDIVRAFPGAPGLRLHVHQRDFPPHLANAGYARHVAMRLARDLAGPRGLLLCTDADATVRPDWLRRNAQAVAAGADAVAGRIEMDAEHVRLLPERLHADESEAQCLTRLLDAIDCRVDPDPADPWPRHAEHSGASIAVTAAAHDAAGGVPPIACAEDRAFFVALRGIDARIRHAPEIVVTVSGRLQGRAAGGMADTLRRRLAARDEFLDDCIEPAEDRFRRATIRATLRRLRNEMAGGRMIWRSLQEVAAITGLPAVTLAERLAAPASFGAIWQTLEAQSAVLQHRLVPASAVADEIATAAHILRHRCGDENLAHAESMPWIGPGVELSRPANIIALSG